MRCSMWNTPLAYAQFHSETRRFALLSSIMAETDIDQHLALEIGAGWIAVAQPRPLENAAAASGPAESEISQ